MWKEALENSALILGLAISAYTIYSAIDSYMIRLRQRSAITQGLHIKMKYMITLADSLAKRAERIVNRYPVKIESGSQRGGLPEESRDDVEELLIRAFHVLEFQQDWDEEKLGGVLNKEQLEAFLGFLSAFQTYREVLTVRARQLKRAPDNAAELSRLRTVANLNLAPVKENVEQFQALFTK